MSLVPNSEADTFLTCEMRHYYAFGEGLQPRSYGAGLSRGIAGHSALEAFYASQKSGDAVAVSKNKMLAVIEAEILESVKKGNSDNTQVLVDLQRLLIEYVDTDEYYNQSEYEILAVEETFRYEDFPFKPDMIVRHRKTREVTLVDHKFLYNFYNGAITNMFPQLPKYVGALRELGFKVHKAEFNMLRHRNNAQQKFRRLTLDIPDKRIKQYQHEHAIASARIDTYKSLGLSDWRESVLRTANSFTCTHCPFATLCQTDLDGLPGRNLLVKSFFEPNTYGYSYLEDDLSA
jgi:hypothetical protein